MRFKKCLHISGFVLGNLFGWNMSSIPELNQAHTLNSTEEFLRAMLSAYPDVDRALGVQTYDNLFISLFLNVLNNCFTICLIYVKLQNQACGIIHERVGFVQA